MSSVPEVNTVEVKSARTLKPRSRAVSDSMEIWSRKLHYYIGLYFLLFIWLFSFSGLMLNHHWAISSWWLKRHQWTSEQAIQPLPAGSDLEKARNVMRQVNVEGEIEWPNIPLSTGQLNFQVTRPGRIFTIHVDLVENRVNIQRIQVNKWGIIQMLHTFSGVRRESPHSQRDWLVTEIWTLCMDGLALGLIFMVLSSYYMWFRFKKKRLRLGFIVLSAGLLICGFFVVGLAWLYK